MSFRGIIKNGVITLPPGMELPEGTEVEVQTREVAASDGKESALGWMAEFAGCIDTLPEDFADEHDHYIHGTPKRRGR